MNADTAGLKQLKKDGKSLSGLSMVIYLSLSLFFAFVFYIVFSSDKSDSSKDLESNLKVEVINKTSRTLVTSFCDNNGGHDGGYVWVAPGNKQSASTDTGGIKLIILPFNGRPEDGPVLQTFFVPSKEYNIGGIRVTKTKYTVVLE